VPQGDIGELLIRSPAPATGYHKLPQVTKERFLEGQWLRTKDLVRADEQGYIKIVGRQDDMINCGGENVYPKEVENVLMTHANIADVAVVPVPDEVKGEVPVAFAVEKNSGDTSPEALKQYFLDNGPAYAHPRKVFIVDELPLTGAKKVDRTRLKELARE
jgi:acyl-CoA synthetase (AMP-forming)/AMP-acid ligase II